MVPGNVRTTRGLCKGFLLLALAIMVPACGKKPQQGLTITGFSPVGGSVARQMIVYIDFDRALDPGTWPTSFTFKDGTGTDVPSIISFNGTINQIAIKPTSGALAGGTTFTVVVLGTLKGADGTTFAGDAFQFTTQPTTATNGGQPTFAGATSATAPVATPGTIVLAWTAATDAPDGDSIQYDVYLSTVSNGENFAAGAFQTTGAGTGVTISGLASNVTFYFVVRAREATSGNIDFNTHEVSAMTN